MQLRWLSPQRMIPALVVVVALAGGCASGAALQPVGEPLGGGAAATAPPQPAVPGGDRTGTGSTVALRDDAKIVRTGTLQLRVADLSAAVRQASAAVSRLDGYVGASHVANDGERSVATITYRVPTDRWDEALEALRSVASEVLGEQTEALEVTGQLVDLAARIDNLRASERSLQAIAEQATRIADVLEVQQRLTEVRGQIEQLGAQQAQLTDRVAYGTLRVTFGLEVVAVTEAARNWNPASEVDRATASLVDILQAVATAGIWIGIVWLPVLAALGVLAGVTAFALRRLGFLRRASPPLPPATTSG